MEKNKSCSSMKKNIKIFFMIGIVAAGTVVAIVFGSANEFMPLGSQLPVLNYVSLNDSGVIKIKDKPLMIMYFKPDCSHCEYEFETLNKNYNDSLLADIIFVTKDLSFIKNNNFKKWENIYKNPSIKFLFVNGEELKSEFGIIPSPTFYFFNKKGILQNKNFGELKYEKILKEINNLVD